MTMHIRSFAAISETAPVALHPISRRSPREDDVSIKIHYCGVCHSDLHQARNEWHNTIYPVVPGHEIIGKVTAVGDKVSKFSVGDWVGVGCLRDSRYNAPPVKKGWSSFAKTA